MAKQTIEDLNLKGKKVLLRADFNVPMSGDEISNDNRIQAALPTIQYILDQGGKLVVFSHLGRVKEEADKKGKSLAPIAKRLGELLAQDVQFVAQTRGKELEDSINNLDEGQVLMVENTRFEDIDGKKESKNDPELGAYWASLGDVFVNDAFGTAHRSHASNVGIAKHLESGVGYLIEKEIKFIGGAVDDPDRPFVAILGGAKVSDKIGVIESLLEKADKVLIGGAMAYTFKKALGNDIGDSLVEEDKIGLAKELMEKASDKLILPVDTVATKEFDNDAEAKVFETNIEDGYGGMDIGPKTIERFEKKLQGAKTVVWNGPMGVFEMSNFAKGTIAVCEALAKLDNATTIIGGGDSATAAQDLGFEDDFSHISTGGGASLEYLEGNDLPGIVAITNK